MSLAIAIRSTYQLFAPQIIGAGAASSRLFHWWLDQLSSLLPRSLLGAEDRTLFAYLDRNALHFRELPGYSIDLAKTEDATTRAAELRKSITEAKLAIVLPRQLVLRRLVEFPLAAEHELEAALSFEVDRQTPFGIDAVYRFARINWRDKERSLLQAELAVTPKAQLNTILESIERVGLSPIAISVEGDDSVPAINFLPAQLRRRARSWRAEPWKPVAIATMLLAIASGLALTWQLDNRVASLQQKIDSLSAAAHRGEALQRQLTVSRAATEFLPSKEETPRALEIIDGLAKAVPEDSWIFNLDISNGEVRIAGFSKNVPKLIETLQQIPFLEKPELRSPVVHDSGGDRDRFDIGLRIKKGEA